jgi:hypothetical protein
MKLSFTYIFAFLLFISCEPDTSTRPVTINNQYAMRIPAMLSSTSRLNEDASMQYQNIMRELYVIVIDEPIDEINQAFSDFQLMDLYSMDLDGYALLILDAFADNLSSHQTQGVIPAKINGLPARVAKVDARVQGHSVFYHIAIFEGKDVCIRPTASCRDELFCVKAYDHS